jgi:hypothetical protein
MRLLLLAQTNDESSDFKWMSFLLIAPIYRRLMLATLLLLQLGHMISTLTPTSSYHSIMEWKIIKSRILQSLILGK